MKSYIESLNLNINNLRTFYPNPSILFISKLRFLNIILIINIIFISLNYTKCDLPVHCKREEIEGHWTFRINKDIFNLSLKNNKSTCGHGFPDKIERLQNDINYSFENFWEIEVFLDKDYTIKDPYTKEPKGKWTPIYDEGFLVNYGNSIFTTFMKYYLKPSSRKKYNNYNKDTKPNDKDYLSNCSKTMIGWFQKDLNEAEKNWSCFFGYKNTISEEFNYPSLDINLQNSNTNLIDNENAFDLYETSNNKNHIDNHINNYNNNKAKGYKRIPKYALRPNKDFSGFQNVIFNEKKNSYEIYNENKAYRNKNNINYNDNKIKEFDPDRILTDSLNKILENKFESNEDNEENDYNNNEEENYQENEDGDLFSFLKSKNRNKKKNKESFLEITSTANSKMKMEDFKYENQMEFVNEINSNELSWKADLHKEFQGFSFMELKNKLGKKNRIGRKKSEFIKNNNSNNSNSNNYKINFSKLNDLKNNPNKEKGFNLINNNNDKDTKLKNMKRLRFKQNRLSKIFLINFLLIFMLKFFLNFIFIIRYFS
jgi:hypothetical protein